MKSSKKLSVVMEKWRKEKKGHFAVYSREGKRFVVPLYHLNHPLFRVLLEIAEEQFGTRVTGPIQVPCEEEFMDYILSVLRKNHSEDEENFPVSMTTCHFFSFPSLWGSQSPGTGNLSSVS
ncbi:putative SAUR-like auxin-responsive protein family [Tripterygium wilfordii]|uniref:Putative SAUR-like auxin-responsive protein family n=1 Tax=Tripterygium wilfordii TaxID=458696 RepID=A0A7J7D3J5_TRIWF|nr:indole-3-acetic acid-induced protein ARG7 [Tripterygium wilfordii]KAF5740924.1 putative SAUR-like auxin-responsive protein family [Tripterygium wilfordii]